MKRYNSIGDLFLDYRAFYGLSQLNLAGRLNIDLRTLQRWEKNDTLIKSDKEEIIVLETLMPYQLIHNLNATVPIPTFYDFRIHKYSLSNQTNALPKLSWYKDQIQIKTNDLRTIDFDYDIKHISKFIGVQKGDYQYVNNNLIKAAIELLPDLNLVITGKSGYYAGHCIVLPLKEKTYHKLKQKEITNKDLRPEDLVNYKQEECPIFYRYDITGDCNDTIFYIMAEFFRFFMSFKQKNYVFGGYTERDDNYDLNLQIGLKVIWEDLHLQKELGLVWPPRFLEGNFTSFLSSF